MPTPEQDVELWRSHYEAALANWNVVLEELTALRGTLHRLVKTWRPPPTDVPTAEDEALNRCANQLKAVLADARPSPTPPEQE